MGNGDPTKPTTTTGPPATEEQKREAAKDLLGLNEKTTKELQQQLKDAKEVAKVYKDMADTVQGSLAFRHQEIEVLQAARKVQEAIVKETNDLIAKGKITAAQAKEALVDARAELVLLENEVFAKKELLDLENQRTASLEDSVKAAEDLGKALGGAFKSKHAVNLDGFAAGAKKMGVAWKGGTAALKIFGKAAGLAGALGIIGTFIGEIKALTLEIDSMEKSFRKGTLASKDMARQMTANYKEMIRFGLTAQEAGEAGSALYTGFTDFTMMSASGQNDIIELTTTMQKLGVSASTTTKALQTSTAAFGMSGRQAKQTILEIEAFAESSRMSFEQLATSYAESAGSLAKFADQGRTFIDLTRIMKITGMQMNDILRITDKFDTFEGAADSAGKLNAALGGNFVNAMDLMMATDPVERFDMIRDSILNAGLSFGTMSYYQRLFFAEAAGLENVGQLNMLLRGDTDALAGSMEAEAKSMADLKKIGMEMVPILEQFSIAFKSIFEDIPAEKIADWLTTFASGLSNMIWLMKALMGIAVGLAVGFGLFFGTAMLPFVAGMSTVAATVWGVIAGVGALLTLLGVFSEKTMKEKQSPFTIMEGIRQIGINFGEIFINAKAAAPAIKNTSGALETLPVDRVAAGRNAGAERGPLKQFISDIFVRNPITNEDIKVAAVTAVAESFEVIGTTKYA